jgi:HD-GYP domain-containing protein (c-di-GMP phosphodiesterase class II)
MDHVALAGTRVLVAGGERHAAEALAAELREAGGAAVEIAAAREEVAARAAAGAPDAVLVLGRADPVRALLDPLHLGEGPAVVALAEVTGGERLGPEGLARLGLVLEHRALRGQVAELEAIVAGQAREAFRDADAVRLDALDRLLRAAEYRDDNTPEHAERVGALAARLARAMALPDRVVRILRRAAPLHDLGKIAIPDEILLKPGPLTPEEYAVVQTHPVLGARVLAGGGSDVFELAEEVVRSHHERWDGGGYPDGSAGADIPVAARIVHVADVFDVLLHERPYKEAWAPGQAVAEVQAGAGTQFDPDVVRAFEALGPAVWGAGPESS